MYRSHCWLEIQYTFAYKPVGRREGGKEGRREGVRGGKEGGKKGGREGQIKRERERDREREKKKSLLRICTCMASLSMHFDLSSLAPDPACSSQ